MFRNRLANQAAVAAIYTALVIHLCDGQCADFAKDIAQASMAWSSDMSENTQEMDVMQCASLILGAHDLQPSSSAKSKSARTEAGTGMCRCRKETQLSMSRFSIAHAVAALDEASGAACFPLKVLRVDPPSTTVCPKDHTPQMRPIVFWSRLKVPRSPILDSTFEASADELPRFTLSSVAFAVKCDIQILPKQPPKPWADAEGPSARVTVRSTGDVDNVVGAALLLMRPNGDEGAMIANIHKLSTFAKRRRGNQVSMETIGGIGDRIVYMLPLEEGDEYKQFVGKLWDVDKKFLLEEEGRSSEVEVAVGVLVWFGQTLCAES